MSRILCCLGAFALGAGVLEFPARAQNAPTPLPFNGATLTQNFNSLSSTNPSPNTNSTLPPGFGFVESGTGGDSLYVAGTGAENAGNTYSFGAAGSAERALGGLQSGSVVPTFGVFLRNDSGATITQFTVSYTGEQYRLGAARADGIPDRLNFQYSTTATALNATAGFTDVDALDFVSPVTTGTAGPVTASTAISATVTGVSIAPGATLVLRWSDFNVASSDDGLAIDDFAFSTSGGGTTTPTPTASPTTTPTPTATPTTTPTPAPPAGPTSGALISEYRWSGPGGALDEFVELINISGAPLNLSNWSVRSGSVTATIPPGTVPIPARGHLLLTGSAYSLGDVGGTGQAQGDVNYAGNFPDGAPLTLRNAAGDEVDGVNGAVLPAPPLNSQSSFVRRQENNSPLDSGNDLSDFNVVEITSTANGAATNTGISGGLLRLGAPGPQNRNSPTVSGVVFGLLNPAQGAYTGDNAIRTGAGNSGTYQVRRTLTNNTGATITRLRFRVAGFTTGTPVGPDAPSIADMRIFDGGAVFQINGIDVMPIRVETVPGGGDGVLNSSVSVTLPSGGVAPDATVAFEIGMRVAKSGTFRLTYLFEAASDVEVAPRPDNDNLLLGDPSLAQVLDAQASNKENLLIEHPALSLGYQKSAGEPKWVSWHLDQSDIGSSGRNSSFPSDPSLPADCRITEGDYDGSGYTRGHQCPSGDRTSSDAINEQVFYMSNMVPQTAALNNGVWNNFEVYCRQLLNNGANELYIMSGGVGSLSRIAGGKVNVPASCWKVVVILPKGGGDLSRITSNTRVLSILVPNTSSVSSSYASYYTSVDNIENQTGLDLLANLSDSIENTLEARQSN